MSSIFWTILRRTEKLYYLPFFGQYIVKCYSEKIKGKFAKLNVSEAESLDGITQILLKGVGEELAFPFLKSSL